MIRWVKKILRWVGYAFLAQFFLASFLYPASNLMMARWVTLRSATRDWVPLSRISPALPRAVIAAEDGKFCIHHGVDWQAMQGAVEELVDDDDDRSHGASTVTMQVAKNLFLWHGRSFIRKGLEVPMALLIDAVWSKRRMMELYLNIAEFGDGIFGVEAASQYYFHKSARHLNTREAALLAAALPNPRKRNPARPSAYIEGYAARIQARMGAGLPISCGF